MIPLSNEYSVTDQEEEEQWCLGRCPPPKQYITSRLALIGKPTKVFIVSLPLNL